MIASANENVIRALSKALADARAGKIEAVMICTATNEGVPDAAFAGEVELMPTINIGIDLAKQHVLAQVGTILMQQTTALRRAVGSLDG